MSPPEQPTQDDARQIYQEETRLDKERRANEMREEEVLELQRRNAVERQKKADRDEWEADRRQELSDIRRDRQLPGNVGEHNREQREYLAYLTTLSQGQRAEAERKQMLQVAYAKEHDALVKQLAEKDRHEVNLRELHGLLQQYHHEYTENEELKAHISATEKELREKEVPHQQQHSGGSAKSGPVDVSAPRDQQQMIIDAAMAA